jgi:hypothetical protein
MLAAVDERRRRASYAICLCPPYPLLYATLTLTSAFLLHGEPSPRGTLLITLKQKNNKKRNEKEN